MLYKSTKIVFICKQTFFSEHNNFKQCSTTLDIYVPLNRRTILVSFIWNVPTKKKQAFNPKQIFNNHLYGCTVLRVIFTCFHHENYHELTGFFFVLASNRDMLFKTFISFERNKCCIQADKDVYRASIITFHEVCKMYPDCLLISFITRFFISFLCAKVNLQRGNHWCLLIKKQLRPFSFRQIHFHPIRFNVRNRGSNFCFSWYLYVRAFSFPLE